MTRRRPVHRLTSALIGAIVTACGVLALALMSGYDLDTELIAIVSLATIGGWLLVTALLASRTPRRHAESLSGPVTEQPFAPEPPLGRPKPYETSDDETEPRRFDRAESHPASETPDAAAADTTADTAEDTTTAPADTRAAAEPEALATPPLTAAARRAAEKARKQATGEL